MRRAPPGWIALAYAAFVAYGSLVPLVLRPRPLADAWAAFLRIPYLDLGVASRADWVANILLYIPLAFLLSGWLSRRLRAAAAILLVFVSCSLLAVAVEFAQLFFPPRTVSLNDLLAELIGTVIGIAVWQAGGARLLERWHAIVQGGREARRALIASYTGAYLLFALFPYDFLLSAAELAQKLASPNGAALFVTSSCGAAFSCSAKLVSEVLIATPLGAFLGMAAGRASLPSIARAFGWGLLLGLVIEGLQTFLASGTSQGASILTRGAGVALGLAVYRGFRKEWLITYRPQIQVVALLALPVYFALLLALVGFYGAALESRGAAMAKLGEVRFLPFYYHYFTTETQAMYSLLIHAGAYAPIGVAVWLFSPRRPGRAAVWVSGAAAMAVALAMETLKLFLQGKRPDPTDALIAAAAAAFTCFALSRLASRPSGKPSPPAPAAGPGGRAFARPHWRGLSLVAGILASGAAIAGWLIAMQPREHYVDESALPLLPAPGALGPVQLPNFRTTHPRLPSPTPAELDILRRYNPAFLVQVRNAAGGGAGDFHSAALQELVQPGSVDMDALHRRLMELRFVGRGQDQVKPLAVAYDWLFDRWSESQRAFLRGKLAEGCQYVTDFIRKERLSPYNVILYNAPFQALMACSIALYKDDPRGGAFLAFTHDLWKVRVLPVWRQVMGRNGGWHEGAEYVGIGIGQAIYQVPAMWRAATGEDLFVQEPGIQGFLDFLIYRTRPDGTHERWGDGANFGHLVPDAVALALEYGHRGFYSLEKRPGEPRPTSWPWGPLTNPMLYDPAATSRLPLSRRFDGIGMVVARSDWSPEATYVTFKAGDNYWSHVHLDQGAFTIFKGGPLAIDSGLYGPRYGSDHHMNYAYQTVAHNTVTVTDPADIVPAPRKDEKHRPIANDGGQRRVGSGWGVEAAPLDVKEWLAKASIYHTGRITHMVDQDGLLIAAADLTPAYTNDLSGKGTFSHRTRRVERFWRVLAYDRIGDVLVVFDDVRSTRAEFRKRWLLHTVEAPRVHAGGFSVAIPAEDWRGRAGGRLDGHVVLPKHANVSVIGGPGFEFFADGRNYDEGGKIRQIATKREPDGPEPGAWRIEVTPLADARDDVFLVVLLPSLLQAAPRHRVEALETPSGPGARITAPRRTLRVTHERTGGVLRFDVEEGAVPIASHRVRLPSSMQDASK